MAARCASGNSRHAKHSSRWNYGRSLKKGVTAGYIDVDEDDAIGLTPKSRA
jgi:hypothetical protein